MELLFSFSLYHEKIIRYIILGNCGTNFNILSIKRLNYYFIRKQMPITYLNFPVFCNAKWRNGTVFHTGTVLLTLWWVSALQLMYASKWQSSTFFLQQAVVQILCFKDISDGELTSFKYKTSYPLSGTHLSGILHHILPCTRLKTTTK